MMQDLSLLDWLKIRFGSPRHQRALRIGLAALAALWAVWLWRSDRLLGGAIVLLVAVALFVWGLLVTGQAVAAPVDLPTLQFASSTSVEAVQELRPAAPVRRWAWVANWRWLGLPGAFFLAIAAHRGWYVDRFAGSPWSGLFLLGLAAVLFVLAVWRDGLDLRVPQWGLAAGTAERVETPVRLRVVIAAMTLSLVTYFTVPDNNFTLVGRLAWAASLVAWALAFWEGPVKLSYDWRGAFERLWRGEVNIRLTRTLFLLILVLIISAFFRFSQLAQVPKDMTSDHVEKLLDVSRIVAGERPIFEPGNGGREVMEFYLAAFVAQNTPAGLSYLALKLVTSVAGFLSLPLIFLFVREVTEDDLTAVLAVLAAGIAWWPNSISRNGLRFPFAMLFAVLALWLALRGIKRDRRNDFILAGLAIGIGLYGYTPIRIVPVAVALALGVYVLHNWNLSVALRALERLVMTGVIALAAFIPMLRYSQDDPHSFLLRSTTRIFGDPSNPIRPTVGAVLQNEWNSLRMFSWTGDVAWIVSPPAQPVLDWIMGGLFVLSVLLLVYRYVRWRHWLDLFLLVGIPVLLLPSTLSLAFPQENPSLHRSATAIPLVFTLIALALRALIEHSRKIISGKTGTAVGAGLAAVVLAFSAQLNWKIVFVDYARNYLGSSQNASEIGEVVRAFAESVGTYDTVWVRAYPYWVDTRAVGAYAGRFGWDQAILNPDDLSVFVSELRPQLFILHRFDFRDRPDGQPPSVPLLRQLFPEGRLSVYHSPIPDHDFLLFFVPGTQDTDENSLPPPPSP
jgi:hypothetical protein